MDIGRIDEVTLSNMRSRGDPLADAVIEELRTNRGTRELVEAGLRAGLQTLDNVPPALAALLAHAEALPSRVNIDLPKSPLAVHFAVDPFWTNTVALGLGALLHVYGSPAIAGDLMRTGKLAGDTGSRLHNTSHWHAAVQLPNGLMRGEAGYVGTLRVRLIHAARRAALLNEGSRQAGQRVPLNQADMLRTWLDFTHVKVLALNRMGFEFSDAELRDLYAYWKYVAYLLGIDPRLYRHVNDHAAAGALLDVVERSVALPDESSRVLTRATLGCAIPAVADLLRTTASNAREFVHAIARDIHGDRIANALGIERAALAPLLPIIVAFNRERHQSLRSDPASWTRWIAANVSAHRAWVGEIDPRAQGSPAGSG